MADDELSAPLGQNAKKQAAGASRCRSACRTSIAGWLGAVRCVACAVWALVVDDPLGGEPIAVVATGFDAAEAWPPPSCRAASRRKARAATTARARRRQSRCSPAPSSAAGTSAAADAAAQHQDRHHHRRLDRQAPGGRRSRRRATSARRSSSACSRRSRHGAIPRIAPDGARPAEIYARADASRCRARKDGPRIAIVVGGLGISANVTQQAIDKLPGPVTFAFAPYGADLERLATQRARRGPRGAAAGADGAVRLSRQRSRPADAADLARRRSRISTACTG